MLRPLDVTAALEVRSGGSFIRINGDGDRLTADAANLRSAVAAYRTLGSSLADMNRVLCSLGLRFDIRIRQVVIGRLGTGARPTWMSALLGFPGVELHVPKLVLVSFQSVFSKS